MTTLFSSTDITTAAPIDAPVRRKQFRWLPILTVLFCISYALMTMLIVEQGATIESQRALIHELFRDSEELSATKMKALKDQRAAKAHQVPSANAQSPSTQTPSTQTPSTQDDQAPSSQAAPQQHAKKQAQQPKQFEAPSRPASDLVDARRALIKI